ncbi:MAG: GNAT family N-acetyltransferase [Ardenticatenaceae bacterium]|nr:GNAT family N-acetyltransferase [Ardenticatenaceae bacterium]
MELANLWSRARNDLGGMRKATKGDAGAILRLLNSAVYTHLHVDWHLPGDWIGAPGFVVLPKPQPETSKNSLSAILFQDSPEMDACLAVAPDPLPAAWVRLVAIRDSLDVEQTLADLLAKALPALRQQGVTQLAWLTVEEWPCPWLPQWGFYEGSAIETYVKEDDVLPPTSQVPGLLIREVRSTDYEALEALEVAAFTPIWRQSARAMAIARPQAFSFDVAQLDGEHVGYQLSAVAEAGAHLVRLTVSPEKQGLGIGSALLRHAFANYHRRGLYSVSLNTQVENLSSQKLYTKFGFKPTGQRLPIWFLDIS